MLQAIPPNGSVEVQAVSTASTTRRHEMKSRVWPPSPKMVTGRPAQTAETKAGMTAA